MNKSATWKQSDNRRTRHLEILHSQKRDRAACGKVPDTTVSRLDSYLPMSATLPQPSAMDDATRHGRQFT